MKLSVERLLLLAKRMQIDELERLAATTRIVGSIGRLVHDLQVERGACSLYLASEGRRFAELRVQRSRDAESAERELRTALEAQARPDAFGNARTTHLLAWVLAGLDDLPGLRQAAARRELSATASITAYSRLIAGLVSLIFEMIDAVIDARISGLLVAFFNLVQGKELAGQERALGALAFASGSCEAGNQRRLLYLLDAQERHFQVFSEFCGEELAQVYTAVETSPCAERLARLRELLGNATPDTALDPELSDAWFEASSERLTRIWDLQCALTARLAARCGALVAEARRELRDSEGLLRRLREQAPARAGQADRFFSIDPPADRPREAPASAQDPDGHERLFADLLRAQTQRLASMEAELGAARRALDERKVVERAKGILMRRLGLAEDEAYQWLRKAAMEHKRRLADVAGGVLQRAASMGSPPA